MAEEQATAEQGALRGQFEVVDESVRRIAVILVGVALSLRATLLQRNALEDLLCGRPGAPPDVSGLRITASLLVLSSLFFFTRLSKRTLCAAPEGGARCSAEIDYKGNLLVLSVALARLWDLLRNAAPAEPSAPETVDIGGEVA